MVTRGKTAVTQGFENTRSGTIYWTLSLYIEADKVAAALKMKPGERVKPSVFSRAQRKHLPSLALRNAIDPLMNDIADREMQGQLQEYLLAAIDEDDDDPGIANLIEAAARVRGHKDLTFRIPESVSWMTEGVRFTATPGALDDSRLVRLRRFWLSHNNGALSYHLSFSHYYGGENGAGYNPSTYYFLSLLQKLAAPKEYTLDTDLLEPVDAEIEPFVDVFGKEPLGIDPLDKIRVEEGAGAPVRFWPFVRTMFEADAVNLFGKLATEVKPGLNLDEGFEKALLDLVPFMEVPGLKVPKSRFMFMLHDERFFDRLMPLLPDTKETASRKLMVQQGCYDAYQLKMRELVERTDDPAHLDGEFWDWVCTRPDYEEALDEGFFARCNPEIDPSELRSDEKSHWSPIKAKKTGDASGDEQKKRRMADLVSALQAGECFQLFGLEHDEESGERKKKALHPPIQRHIPAFEARRTDCLDYLFLAGFNQNIIDFMNQDTSEILDSIDPIYPDSSDQSDERFFVRYANHRAIITYVPKSRSLEIGNDYIGTCPYAFLIHALALHNEFLARSHEAKSLTRIRRIDALIKGAPLPQDDEDMKVLQANEGLDKGSRFDKAETAINQAKLATFDQYERYRYENPFRYDTERDVFAKLEELRGVSRKKEAMALAVANLEDHAADLQLRHQKKVDKESGQRGVMLSILLASVTLFGAGEKFYAIGEKVAEAQANNTDVAAAFGPFRSAARLVSGDQIVAWTEGLMAGILVLFLFFLALTSIYVFVLLMRAFLRWLSEPEYDPPQKGFWGFFSFHTAKRILLAVRDGTPWGVRSRDRS